MVDGRCRFDSYPDRAKNYQVKFPYHDKFVHCDYIVWVFDTYFNLDMKKIWRIWAKALGEKAGTTDKESDVIAITRTVIVLTYIITNICIVAGIIRHW